MSQSDGELAIRAQARDATAFTTLIRRHERQALAVGYAVVGDSHRAADIVQEAFIRAWERISELQDVERFGGWLCRMVRNLAIDERRKRPLRLVGEFVENLDRPHADCPSQKAERDETRSRIQAALDGLDELTRSAVVLRYYENLSSKEIAELLDLTPAAVDMRLSRARAELKSRLVTVEPIDASQVGINLSV